MKNETISVEEYSKKYNGNLNQKDSSLKRFIFLFVETFVSFPCGSTIKIKKMHFVDQTIFFVKVFGNKH